MLRSCHDYWWFPRNICEYWRSIWDVQNPGDRACCRANNAECNSCVLGISEEEFCASNPTVSGCEVRLGKQRRFRRADNSDDRECCRAMTAQCLSCSFGMTEEEFCVEYPETIGCATAKLGDSCICGGPHCGCFGFPPGTLIVNGVPDATAKLGQRTGFESSIPPSIMFESSIPPRKHERGLEQRLGSILAPLYRIPGAQEEPVL